MNDNVYNRTKHNVDKPNENIINHNAMYDKIIEMCDEMSVMNDNTNILNDNVNIMNDNMNVMNDNLFVMKDIINVVYEKINKNTKNTNVNSRDFIHNANEQIIMSNSNSQNSENATEQKPVDKCEEPKDYANPYERPEINKQRAYKCNQCDSYYEKIVEGEASTDPCVDSLDECRQHDHLEKIAKIYTVETTNRGAYFMDIKVGNSQIRSLIDTGASLCIIPSKILQKLDQTKCPELDMKTRYVLGVSNSLQPIKSRRKICFNVDDRKYEAIFHELEKAPRVLIGSDWLTTYGAIHNHKETTITIQDHVIALQGKHTKSCVVKVCRLTTLPGDSITKLPVMLNIPVRGNDLYEIKPAGYFKSLYPTITVNGGVTETQNTVIEVINTTPTQCFLPPGTVIGVAHTIDRKQCITEEDVTPIHEYIKAKRLNLPIPEHLKGEKDWYEAQVAMIGEDTITQIKENNTCMEGVPYEPERQSYTMLDLDEPKPIEQPTQPDNHLENVKFDLGNLPVEDHQRFLDLFMKYKCCFSTNYFNLGKVKGATHHIKLVPEYRVVSTRPYTIHPSMTEELHGKLKQQLQAGIIEPCHGPWRSPCMGVRKPSGGVRVVIDYRKTNEQIAPESFPLNTVQSCLERISYMVCKNKRANKNTFFTVIDFFSGFDQIELAESSRDITGFHTDCGVFRHTRLPQGLVSSPSAFCNVLNRILSTTGILHKINGLLYVDDIILCSSDPDALYQALEILFEKLKEVNLTLSPDKCKFYQVEVPYLGFVLTGEGFKPNPSKKESVRNYSTPSNVKEVRQFIGLVSFYRQFIQNFSLTAKCLYNLVKKDIKFEWTMECQEAFDKLKNQLTSSPTLIHFDFLRPVHIYADACHSGVAYTMLHKKEKRKDGTTQAGGIITMNGKTLNQGQLKKTIHWKELYSLALCMRRHHHLLIQCPKGNIKLYSDRKAIIDLAKAAYLKAELNHNSDEIQRMLMEISSYSPTWVHVKGEANQAADALSRTDLGPAQEGTPTKLQEYFGNVENSLESCDSEQQMHNSATPKRYEDPITPYEELVLDENSTPLQEIYMITEEEDSDLEEENTMESTSIPEEEPTQETPKPTQQIMNLEEDILEMMESPHLPEIPRENAPYLWVLSGEGQSSITDSEINAETEPIFMTRTSEDKRFLDLPKLQREDPELEGLYRTVLKGEIDKDDQLTRFQLVNFDNYSIHDGVLKFHYQLRRKQRIRDKADYPQMIFLIETPRCLRYEIIEQTHRELGHAGATKMFHRIIMRFHWSNMFSDIDKYCKSCEVCQKSSRNLPPPPPLKQLPQTHNPFYSNSGMMEIASMDILGPLKESREHYKYLLTFVISISGYPFAEPMRKCDGISVAKALHSIFTKFGAVTTIRTDLGTQLLSDTVKSLEKLWCVGKPFTTMGYCPEQNSRVERTHRTFSNSMRKYVGEKHNTWPDYLNTVLYGIRAQPNGSETLSPIMCMCAFQPKTVLEMQIDPRHTEISCADRSNLGTFIESFIEARKIVLENIKETHEYNKKNFDKKAKIANLKVNDLVYKYTPVLGDHLTQQKKFAWFYTGPYKITYASPDASYFRIQDIQNGIISGNISARRLKRCYLPQEQKVLEAYKQESIYGRNNTTDNKINDDATDNHKNKAEMTDRERRLKLRNIRKDILR